MSKKITVRIPNEAIWEDFKTFVIQKHDKKHTVLGQEVEKALVQYLQAEGFYSPPISDENYNRHMSEPAAAEGNTHTNEDSSYMAIYADLKGMKEIVRTDMERILTRRLNLKTDKSRRDHLKTLEYRGILHPHPKVGHKVLSINPDISGLEPDLF